MPPAVIRRSIANLAETTVPGVWVLLASALNSPRVTQETDAAHEEHCIEMSAVRGRGGGGGG